MYSQNSNLTPAPKAGPHLHPWYVPMHPFWGQLPSEFFESNHVWLSLQEVTTLLNVLCSSYVQIPFMSAR